MNSPHAATTVSPTNDVRTAAKADTRAARADARRNRLYKALSASDETGAALASVLLAFRKS
jgi:hypothetical protein